MQEGKQQAHQKQVPTKPQRAEQSSHMHKRTCISPLDNSDSNSLRPGYTQNNPNSIYSHTVRRIQMWPALARTPILREARRRNYPSKPKISTCSYFQILVYIGRAFPAVMKSRGSNVITLFFFRQYTKAPHPSIPCIRIALLYTPHQNKYTKRLRVPFVPPRARHIPKVYVLYYCCTTYHTKDSTHLPVALRGASRVLGDTVL